MERLKRGDTREDGMVFWGYDIKRPNGERWVTREKFEEKKKQKKQTYQRKASEQIEKKLKCGHEREDGMIFFRYNPIAKNGEIWITKEKFEQLKIKRSVKHKKRYENDEKYKKRFLTYAEKNKPKIAARMREYCKKRSKVDRLFLIRKRIGGLIRDRIKKHEFQKRTKTQKILGCTFAELKAHLESQFQEGMSWDNVNEWHIDHIIPTSLAKTEEQLIYLNHYTNLRPMWAIDNIRKSNKVLPADEKKYKDFKKKFDSSKDCSKREA